MLVKKYWTFTQENPSNIWVVNNVPEGAIGPVITHIEAVGGAILQPEDQKKSPDGLELVFGINSVSGVAYGDYFVEEEEPNPEDPSGGDSSTTSIEGTGGVINVAVHQYNGTDEVAKEPVTFQG